VNCRHKQVVRPGDNCPWCGGEGCANCGYRKVVQKDEVCIWCGGLGCDKCGWTRVDRKDGLCKWCAGVGCSKCGYNGICEDGERCLVPPKLGGTKIIPFRVNSGSSNYDSNRSYRPNGYNNHGARW